MRKKKPADGTATSGVPHWHGVQSWTVSDNACAWRTGVTDTKTKHSAMGLGGEEGTVADKKVKLLDADLLIVDEFSMVDMWLAQQMVLTNRMQCIHLT